MTVSLDSLNLDSAIDLLEERLTVAWDEKHQSGEASEQSVEAVREVIGLIQGKWADIDTRNFPQHDADAAQTMSAVREEMEKRKQRLASIGIHIEEI